ncbi:hypothetical protein SKAU_G00243420 [Synaphobranchus kaupii]|uniref:Uncharacterized protein n=1 Tax=Synaphobranchus kaupii TaxID=118154 RepID=A0A9Q1F8F6_SYNKA|nr:hypothetical protein SKAU_G00243420 [Synaphobranchus kaupii]
MDPRNDAQGLLGNGGHCFGPLVSHRTLHAASIAAPTPVPGKTNCRDVDSGLRQRQLARQAPRADSAEKGIVSPSPRGLGPLCLLAPQSTRATPIHLSQTCSQK